MSVPTKEELERLTLRGLAAYAVRCSLRVQPFVELSEISAEHRNAVVHANRVAADFVCDGGIPTAAADASKAARAAGIAASIDNNDLISSNASIAAACAAAVARADHDANARAYEAGKYSHGAYAYAAYDNADETEVEYFDTTATDDYQKIRELTDGQEGVGAPINLDALGPLWPNGERAWVRSRRREN